MRVSEIIQESNLRSLIFFSIDNFEELAYEICSIYTIRWCLTFFLFVVNKVSGFFTLSKEKYPIEVSGFAINLKYFLSLSVDFQFSTNTTSSWSNRKSVSKFLENIVNIDELEPKANCKQVRKYSIQPNRSILIAKDAIEIEKYLKDFVEILECLDFEVELFYLVKWY